MYFLLLKAPAFAGVFYFMDLMAALVAALLIYKLTSRIAPKLETALNRVCQNLAGCAILSHIELCHFLLSV